jgi:hypothetical protein
VKPKKQTAQQLRAYLGTLIPAGVLTWSLAMLTLSYMGVAGKLDSAFISSLVTTVLAAYGITRKEEEKKDSPPRSSPTISSSSTRRGRPPGQKNRPKTPPKVIPPPPP